jgi:competence ComEA-like helix-hairpin-helix protein
MLNSLLSDYFGFNKQQRNGLVVLSIISLALLAARLFYPYFLKPDNISVKNLPLEEISSDTTLSAHEFRSNTADGKDTKLFVFDPNTVSLEQLLKLGFREKLAARFIKLRSKGFVFRTKKDVTKVYGISESFYAALEPYILIGKEENTQSKSEGTTESDKRLSPKRTSAHEKQNAKLELNSADSSALLAINGIGPSFARRILKYRSMLGGFVALEQLKEVYGLTEEIYQKISPFFTVDPALIKKIDLNKDDFKTINKHPYLTYELTKSLLNWRRKTVLTGANIKDIIGDEQVYRKVLPYLAF